MTRARKSAGRIQFVGCGLADASLITGRGAEAIRHADVVVVDTDVPAEVRALFGGEVTETTDDPAAVAKALVAEAKTGARIARVVTGDVLSSDRMVKEISAVSRSSVPYQVIAAAAAPHSIASYAGIPTAGTVVTADLRGFEAGTSLAGLAGAGGTLLLTFDLPDVKAIAKALIEAGLSDSTPAAVTVNGTSLAQKTIAGVLGDLTGSNPDVKALEGPAQLTVGPGAAQTAKFAWWEKRALYGWQVLVPRTKEQAADMSNLLREHGAIPIEVPTIAVEPPRTPAQMERAIKGLVNGRYSWIVFTSTNAVKAVWEKFTDFGLDARAFAGVKIACVGEATADAVRAFGVTPELVPEGEQSSVGLLEVFPPYDDVLDPIDKVLLPRADIATETLAEGLKEAGWEIEDVTAYRTVRAAPPAAHIRESIKGGGFDAVCFTSSSTVRNLVGIAGKPHARTVVACIGPATAATAKEFGLRVDVQPETADVPSLIEALADYAINLRDVEGFDRPPRKTKSRARKS
ncbi:uroporphyrinogen-III synthase [Blastococcus sp. Marseille-P5729]|uniref:uroporphyrinogen-III synthase n=1 Tax=Blastococcus sp. Marseille-P5729 TaxID=2086582 RepID=UPI000D0F99C0|nr:uroporphyrinogen-III synthase [Blastococcus sp. Marseille-P5729]